MDTNNGGSNEEDVTTPSGKVDFPTGGLSLTDFFEGNRKAALAFSGGCDSSYLLSRAQTAGIDVKAYMVKSAFQAAFEVEDAQRLTEELGAHFEVIEVSILEQEAICANPENRCYLCKHFIFSTISAHMRKDGYEVLMDGTNATDDPKRRPGFKALSELGVVSPLRLAGLTKEQIRKNSRKIGLFTADKPSFSCLATKVPFGNYITSEVLSNIEKQLQQQQLQQHQ